MVCVYQTHEFLETIGRYIKAIFLMHMTVYGLQITFASWAGEGRRYTSIKMADGSELNPSKLYTVGLWKGTVDTTLVSGVDAEYEDTVSVLLQEWIKAQGGTIKPENDNFKLDWIHTDS